MILLAVALLAIWWLCCCNDNPSTACTISTNVCADAEFPQDVVVTISGVTNGTCDECDGYNGTYVFQDTSNPCFFATAPVAELCVGDWANQPDVWSAEFPTGFGPHLLLNLETSGTVSSGAAYKLLFVAGTTLTAGQCDGQSFKMPWDTAYNQDSICKWPDRISVDPGEI